MTEEQISRIEREVGLRDGDIVEHTESGIRGRVRWLVPSETADDLVVDSAGKFYRLVLRIDGKLTTPGWSPVELHRPELA